MKLMLRALAAGSLLAALTGAGFTAYPAFARDTGFDFWESPDLQKRITACKQRARGLDRKGTSVVNRTMVRSETVDELLEGRLTLEEVVRRFVELNRSEPEMMGWVQSRFPGDTEEDRATWQLVSHLRVRLHPRAQVLADELACLTSYPAYAH
jgi:hypothetical protein